MDSAKPLSLPLRAKLTIIDAFGDVLITFADDFHPDTVSFRVSAERLRDISRYFNTLLHPQKFKEGAAFEIKKAQLLQSYKSIEKIPDSELPHFHIHGVGRLGPVKDLSKLMEDFLAIIHLKNLNSSSSQPSAQSLVKPGLSNLANLIAVAFHFDVIGLLKDYVRKEKILAKSEVSVRRSSIPGLLVMKSDVKLRQTLLISVYMDHPELCHGSEELVLRGSSRTQTTKSDDNTNRSTLPLWFDLPNGLEEEITLRRQALISTLSSLQSHLIQQYASADSGFRCRYGYNSSRNCDIYQLGELTRFLYKNGSISLESTMAGTDAMDAFDGDVRKAITLLKSFPSYQLDENHQNCGPKDALLEHLGFLENLIPMLSICQICWVTHKSEIQYNIKTPLFPDTKYLGSFKKRVVIGSDDCRLRHQIVRDILMAKHKDWHSMRESKQ